MNAAIKAEREKREQAEVIVSIGGTDFVFHPRDEYERHNLEVLVADRDQWMESAAGYGSDAEEAKNKLLAAQDALLKARETIHALHGDVAWEIYENHSPEMKMIDAALASVKERQT